MPKLISQQQVPADLTLYLEINFGAPATAKTAVYFPAGYPPNDQLDIVLYLHGHGAAAIDHYLADQRFTLREEVNDAEKWMVLVAPCLGASSQAGNLVPSGLDSYIDEVLDGIAEHAPQMVGDSSNPRIGNLYLASHSGGGEPMRQLAWLAGTATKYGNQIRECWGFDCLYHPTTNPRVRDTADDDGYETEDNWLKWGVLHPQCRLYVHYTDHGGTKIRSENLDRFAHNDPRWNFNMGFGSIYTGNIFVTPSDTQVHDNVPKRYLKERINNCRVV